MRCHPLLRSGLRSYDRPTYLFREEGQGVGLVDEAQMLSGITSPSSVDQRPMEVRDQGAHVPGGVLLGIPPSALSGPVKEDGWMD
jgi:hypothetical protein